MIISTALSFYINGRNVAKRTSLVFVYTLTMEMAMVMQVMIVAIYWPVLHAPMLTQIKGAPNEELIYWTMVFIHTLPFFGVAINVWITPKVEFMHSHYTYFIQYGVFYMFLNFLGTKYRGKPVYPFITWEDWTTVIVLAVLMALELSVFFLTCYVVNWTKSSGNAKKVK